MTFKGNLIKVGEQEKVIDEEYLSHLLDQVQNEEVYLGIKPDYVSMEEIPNSIQLGAKLEFIEQKTGYQAVYFSIKGIPYC